MKILILYGYNKGLLSAYFQELSEQLFKDGFEVFNFYLKNEKVFFIQNGVSIYGEKGGYLISNYRAIYKVIKKTRPDVVISNFSYINPAILFGKLLGVKHNIAWFHTAFGHTQPNFFKIWNKSIYLQMADLVFTNSRLLEHEMHTVYGVHETKTRRIPFWTSISSYSSSANGRIFETTDSDTISIGCPGRLLANKNHAMVIEAVYHLKQSNPNQVRLYIAGNGEYKNELETLVKKLNLEEEVIFLGLLNVNEMTAFYEAMDVIVLPSFHEAFGLVFIETIALGIPVLVSNTFGALDFIDPQKFSLEDFSFHPQSIQELIDKLEPYLNTKGLKPSYFKRMYEETFKKEVIYKQLKTIILNQNVPS